MQFCSGVSDSFLSFISTGFNNLQLGIAVIGFQLCTTCRSLLTVPAVLPELGVVARLGARIDCGVLPRVGVLDTCFLASALD